MIKRNIRNRANLVPLQGLGVNSPLGAMGLFLVLLLVCSSAFAAEPDFTWTSPSHNSSESMPCGGGDIGMNVWVENGDVLFYVSRSGAFDENNTMLKQGRFRVRLSPNPFLNGAGFRQELKLNDGYVQISANGTTVQLWVDVFKPVIHLEIKSGKSIFSEIRYESWRYVDRLIRKNEGQQNSYKWAVPNGMVTLKDSIMAAGKYGYFLSPKPFKNSL